MFPNDGSLTFFVLCTLVLIYCNIISVNSLENRVVCYYTNWSVYRPGTAKFNPQNINPYLCTHLVYAFGGFTKENTLKPFDKYQDIEQGGYAKFTGLKTYNKDLKVMLAIGGWNEGSTRFSPLVANEQRRQEFVKNIIKYLRQNRFDGLDLDWEYPAYRDGGKARDRDNYAKFVQELREEFDRESSKTGRPRLLLTMAVPAGTQYIEKGYDIPKLNKYLDWFNLLTYDYHSAYEPSTNHHAPLYPLEEDDEYNFDSELNIDHTIKFYVKAGAERSKLVLGIPTYGRTYTLFNPDSTDIGAPTDGPGDQGDATKEKGFLAYYEICQKIKEEEWTVVQPNERAMGPFAFKDNQWVGYDDEAMARKKSKFVIENGLGGIMFWSIDNDDFRGLCNGKKYPLIEAAKEELFSGYSGSDNVIGTTSPKKKPTANRRKPTIETTTAKTIISKTATKRPRTTARPTGSSLYIGLNTPEPPTTPDPGSDFKCQDEGFFEHPRDCKKYFWCLDSGPSNLGIVAHQFTCPTGLVFNKDADSCDYARNVECSKKPPPTAKTVTTPTTSTTEKSKINDVTKRINFNKPSTTTTTTTTVEPEIDEDDYEYEDDGKKSNQEQPAEEDPEVLKELIKLIKKVGGVEELEKQLRIQEDGEIVMKDSKDQISTTPSSISKDLYERVLNKASGGTFLSKNRFSSSFTDKTSETEKPKSDIKYSSVVRNSRPGPQNSGLDKLPEFDAFLQDKPKYTTINRQRPDNIAETIQATLAKEKTEDEYEYEDVAEEKSIKVTTTTQGSTQYVNISRQRSTTVTTTTNKPDTGGDYDYEPEEEDIKTTSKPAVQNRFAGSRRTTTERPEVTTPSNRYQTLTRTRSRLPSSTKFEAVTQDGGANSETSENDAQVPESFSTPSVTLKSSVVYAARPFQFSRRGTSTSTSAPATSREPVKEVSARNQFPISIQRNNPQNTLTQKTNEVNGKFEHLDDSFRRPALRNSIQKIYTDNELAQSTLSYKTVNFQIPEENFEWKEPTYRVNSAGPRGSIKYRPLGDTNDGRYIYKADTKGIGPAQSSVNVPTIRVSQKTGEDIKNYSNEKFDSIPLSTSLEDYQSSHEQNIEHVFENQKRKLDVVTEKTRITENPTERYLLTLAHKISFTNNSTESSVPKLFLKSANSILTSPNKLLQEKMGKSLKKNTDQSINQLNYAEITTLGRIDTPSETNVPLSVDAQFINDQITLNYEDVLVTTESELDTPDDPSLSTPIPESSILVTTTPKQQFTQKSRSRPSLLNLSTTDQTLETELTTLNFKRNFRGRQRTNANKAINSIERSSTTEGSRRSDFSRKLIGNQRQNLNLLRRPTFTQKTDEVFTDSEDARTRTTTILPTRFNFVRRKETTPLTLETEKEITSEIPLVRSTQATTDEITRSLPIYNQSRRPFKIPTTLRTTTTEESTTYVNYGLESEVQNEVQNEESSTQLFPTFEENTTYNNNEDMLQTTILLINEDILTIQHKEKAIEATTAASDLFLASTTIDNEDANYIDKPFSDLYQNRGTTRFRTSFNRNNISTSTESRGLRKRVLVKRINTTTVASLESELNSSTVTSLPKTPLYQTRRRLGVTKTVQDNFITKTTENQLDIESTTRRKLFARPKITPDGNSNALKNEQVLLLTTRPTRPYSRTNTLNRRNQTVVPQNNENNALLNTNADQIFFSQDNVAGSVLNETSQNTLSDKHNTNDSTNPIRRRKLIRKKIIRHDVDENNNNSTYPENVSIEETEGEKNASNPTKKIRKVIRRLQPINRNDTKDSVEPTISEAKTEELSVQSTPSYRRKIVRKLRTKASSDSDTTQVTKPLPQSIATNRPRTIVDGRQLQTSRSPIISRLRTTTQEPEQSESSESVETENKQDEKKPKSISNSNLGNTLYTRKPGIFKPQFINKNVGSEDDNETEDQKPVIRKPLYTRKPVVTSTRTTTRRTTIEDNLSDDSEETSDENEESSESDLDENNYDQINKEPQGQKRLPKRPQVFPKTEPTQDPKVKNDNKSDEDGDENNDEDNDEDTDEDNDEDNDANEHDENDKNEENDENDENQSEENEPVAVIPPIRNFQNPANRPSYKPNFVSNRPVLSIQNIPTRTNFKRPSVRPLLQKPKNVENSETDYDNDDISNEVASKNDFSTRRPSLSRPVTRLRPDVTAAQQSTIGTVSTRNNNAVRTRTYVRKYSPSTTAPENQISENLLENINITALNNRNKQIFSKSKDKFNNKKKVINSPVSTTQLVVETNDTDFEPDFDTTTTDDTTDTTDNTVEFHTNKHEINTEVSNPPSNNSQETTTQKPTTLHHIFAIDIDNNNEATTSPVESGEEIIQKLEKLIEINRIEEVYSKSQKDSTNLVLEKEPTLSKFGEFSRLTSIKLHNNHKMSATDTKSLTDSVIHRIKIITSDAATKDGKSLKISDEFFQPDSSKLPLENLFDQERHGKQINSGIAKPVPPQIILQPQFNETNPLVISIANLDQVILSKVEKKPDGVALPSAKVSTIVDDPNSSKLQSDFVFQTKTVTSEVNRGTLKRPKASSDQFLAEVNREGVPLLNIKVIPTRIGESDTE